MVFKNNNRSVNNQPCLALQSRTRNQPQFHALALISLAKSSRHQPRLPLILVHARLLPARTVVTHDILLLDAPLKDKHAVRVASVIISAVSAAPANRCRHSNNPAPVRLIRLVSFINFIMLETQPRQIRHK